MLAKGSAGWLHHPLVAPRPGEIVVEKRNSSAFHDTHLHRHLSHAGIERLVIAGMQTEMCVDSACRGAKALDYRVVLVADAHTTYDTPALSADLIIAHHNRLLSRAFVELVEAEHVQF
jgi:nicotinamidase-related amidase